MSYSERLGEFAPTVDPSEGKGGLADKTHRTIDQFLAETGIDVSADIQRTGGEPSLHDFDGLGTTSERQTEYGADYWFSRLDYWQDGIWKGCRMIAEIPPGCQHEFVYWAKEAPEKPLTIHQGSGEIVSIDPADGTHRVVEFENQTAETSLPSGVFYTLRANPESNGPFVISGFYEELVDWSAVEIVVRPGETVIETPDGDLPVPLEFQTHLEQLRLEEQAAEIERQYKELGLESERASDEPDKVYEPHSHHPVRLFGLRGSAEIKVGDADWQVVNPGDEVVIAEGEVHEAKVGPDGWDYIFAYPADT